MVQTFDTLAATDALEDAGMERKRAKAKAVAGAIRAGQGGLWTKDDISALKSDTRTLQSVVGIQLTISLATLAAVLALTFRP